MNNLKRKNIRSGIGRDPILKWVGGKRVILEILVANIKFQDRPLIEPFIGGGALAFSAPVTNQILIGDLNAELVNLYKVVKGKSSVINLIETLNSDTFYVSEDNYYQVREWDKKSDFESLDDILKAARTFYLNKTGFNGLFRVNAKGKFNVPFGQKAEGFRLDTDAIMQLHELLSARLPNGRHRYRIAKPASYDSQINAALRGKNSKFTIYLDPPYASAPPNAGKKSQSFKTYQKDGFTNDDQLALAMFVKGLTKNGHQILLSNVDTSQVRGWYKGLFYLEIPSVRRSVSGKTSGRTGVNEILISNYPLRYKLNGVDLKHGKL
jgi:DNA adenine methylase